MVLAMDRDWEVEAIFNCSGGVGPMLPMALGALALWVSRRRWI